MTQTYFPFNSGAGANVTEPQWKTMARLWRMTGVIPNFLNCLQVYGDSSGMQIKVKSGAAWMEGHYFSSDAEVVLPISASDASLNRIDRIAVHLDWNANTISLVVITGSLAASPSAPAVTQTSTVWEISLAQVYVGATVLTINAGNVTDERASAWSTPEGSADQHGATVPAVVRTDQYGRATLDGLNLGTATGAVAGQLALSDRIINSKATACVCGQGSGVSWSASSWYLVTYAASAAYDPAGMRTSNSRITAPVTGVHIIHMGIAWPSNSAAKLLMQIRKNSGGIQTGGTYIAQTICANSGNGDDFNLCVVDYATAGDYYETFGWHNNGSAIVVTGRACLCPSKTGPLDHRK